MINRLITSTVLLILTLSLNMLAALSAEPPTKLEAAPGSPWVSAGKVSTQQDLVELETLQNPKMEKTKLDPETLYKYVWSWIYCAYCDTSFGGQDWNSWRYSKLYPQPKNEAEIYATITSMLASLKRPTVELVDRHKSFGAGTIGCLLVPADNNRWQVGSVVKDSGAARVGVRIGDIINTINGVAAPEKSSEVRRMLRGTPNTEVNVQFIRNGNPVNLKLLRKTEKDIEPQSFCTMLPGNIAYIKPALPLAKETLTHFKTAITSLKNANGKGLIFDLRSNVGNVGELSQVCGAFVGDKKTGAGGTSFRGRVKCLDAEGEQLIDLPMVVLVNSSTNGTCELLADCLKYHKRAKLVGDTTSGTGLLVNHFIVDQDYELVMPSTQLVTCDDNPIEGRGVTPDVQVPVDKQDIVKGPWWHYSADGKPPSITSGKDVQLQRAILEMSKMIGTK